MMFASRRCAEGEEILGFPWKASDGMFLCFRLCYDFHMTFELFHVSYGFRRATAMAYDEDRKYYQLFLDLDQKIRSGDRWVVPRELQPGMKFELTAEEITQAKTA